MVLASAVRQYVESRTPMPMRFMTAVGTDSAMPTAGMAVLQAKGPTYLFPADSAGQETVKAQLTRSPWGTLLVTYHGIEQVDAGTAHVRIGGTWIIGDDAGSSSGYEDVEFRCSGQRWFPRDSVPETGSLPVSSPSISTG